MNTSLLRKYPVTITVSVIALLAWANPSLSDWLQLDFNAVSDGQWWRIWTGHLTHYDGSHLFWDLLMFAVLGGACEHRYPRPFAAAIAVMIAFISVAIPLLCEQVTVYRGLSGIDTGLFVWFVADQCRDCWHSRDRVSVVLWLSLSMGLIGKLLYEITTGQILFVDASGFTPLVESHLAGAAIGLICCVGVGCLPGPKSAPGLNQRSDAHAGLRCKSTGENSRCDSKNVAAQSTQSQIAVESTACIESFQKIVMKTEFINGQNRVRCRR